MLLAAVPYGGAAQPVVVNEIHYADANPTLRSEFLELHNPGTNAVDLSGWNLTGAVEYSFPNRTVLAGGGYLTVAQDPPTILTTFGVAALGPWLGKLDNDGEEVVLKDTGGATVDEVDYRAGFPWPTTAQGEGPSMELVHPSLDNDLGGSWRSSTAGYGGPEVTFVPPLDPEWRYRKGSSQPAIDSGGRQWFESGYDESAGGGWLTGPAPIGYGDGDDATVLTDMRNQYITVFLRREFTIAPGQEIPTTLLVRAYFDDGCVVYLNGHEIKRFSLSAGPIPFPPPDGFALDHEAAWEQDVVSVSAASLQAGTNTIAVQVINGTLGSSDLSFDMELKTPPPAGSGAPTPGAQNLVFSSVAPPQIRQVDHAPPGPTSGEAVTVTAKITDPQGVSSVTFSYQVVEPGSYIRLTDVGYETGWTEIPMQDDGMNGDVAAGDSRYTAVVPAGVQVHRRLIRYRISAVDTEGAGLQVPYPDDPQPNFAYFCYDGVPAWQGADQPEVTSVETFSSELLESLPVYHLLAVETDVTRCQYNASYRHTRFRGTLVYDDEVYDHIEFNIRGEYSTYVTGKNKWRFRFNRGHYFQACGNHGKKYRSRWKDIKANAGAAPWTPPNRGMAGIDECLPYRLFELAGVPSSRTSYFHFRVIDRATEANPSNQYDGDLWGLYYNVEVPSPRFLDDRDLPDGNLYKLENPFVQHNQGVDEPIGPADIAAVRNLMSTSRTEQWWRDHVDHLAYGRYKGVAEAVTHYDQRDGKQGYYFHNPEMGKWVLLPWDLDTMFQLTAKYYTWDRIWLVVDPGYPNLLREAINEQREILDLLFNEKAVDTVIAEFVSIVNPAGQTLTWADVDQFMWNHHPRMVDKGSFNLLTAEGHPANHSYWRTLISANHEGQMDYVRKFMQPGGYGYDHLVAEVADSAIPDTPSIAYIGAPGYPLNGLSFQCSGFSDPQGSGTFAAMEWRAGEVLDLSAPAYDPTEAPPYEITATWESGELSTFNAGLTLPVDALKVGHAYRVRVRMMDDTGRWSHWSDAAELVAAEASTAGALISHLRVSELMYDPNGGGDFEFIELHNASTNLTLDLGGAAFTSGVDYNFPGGTTLDPGGYLLVTRNTNSAAFRAHYGLDAGVTVAGPYAGKLANDGEQVKLKTAPGGSEIASFDYSNGRTWPLAAAGANHSLVPVDPSASGQATGALDYPGNWRASAHRGGSPGAADPEPPAPTVVLSEITAHTDYSNPSKPEYDSDDWIEIYNTTGTNIYLAGWYLSDTPSDPAAWAIPAVSIAAGERLVFSEVNDFHNPITSGFGMNKAGEQVLLSYLPGTAADRVVDAVGFKGQENGSSLSGYPDGAGFWYATDLSQGGANSNPRPGLRLAEVMYQPPLQGTNDNVRDEYVEIHNPTASDVTMQNVAEPWRLNGGIEYAFPDNTLVPAGGSLLVVSFDPAESATSNAFTAAYGITNSPRLFGPYAGKLGNRSDRVTLERPQLPDQPGDAYSWVIEDETVYGNQNPWPVSAAGTGHALARKLMNKHGADPGNWHAAAPTPGAVTVDADADNDGMRDDWEETHGLDPGNAADALVDLDDDGMSNLEEYIADTDPRSAASVLLLDIFPGTDDRPLISYSSSGERHYTIEKARPSLGEGWATAMPERPGNGGAMEWAPPADVGGAVYRLKASLTGMQE